MVVWLSMALLQTKVDFGFETYQLAKSVQYFPIFEPLGDIDTTGLFGFWYMKDKLNI
jgi:hypothetical protein